MSEGSAERSELPDKKDLVPSRKTPLITALVAFALFAAVSGDHLWKGYLGPDYDERVLEFASDLLDDIANGGSEEAIQASNRGDRLSEEQRVVAEATTGAWSVQKVGVVANSRIEDQFDATVMALVESRASGVALPIKFQVSMVGDSAFGGADWEVDGLLVELPVDAGGQEGLIVNGVEMPATTEPIMVFPGEFTFEDRRFGTFLEGSETTARVGFEEEPWGTDEWDLVNQGVPFEGLEVSAEGDELMADLARRILDSCVEEDDVLTVPQPDCPYSLEESTTFRYEGTYLTKGDNVVMEVVDYPEIRGKATPHGAGFHSLEPGAIRVQFDRNPSDRLEPPNGARWSFLCTLDYGDLYVYWEDLSQDVEASDVLRLSNFGESSATSVCVPETQ
ncbi:hypothetical protein [Salininema proteolyticum]|uniref:DUF4878 domain-containing protein n=1 Tax=Salininema proteolyticum TaxID=1607685 RepID=A0ABV8TVD7_9ACTN